MKHNDIYSFKIKYSDSYEPLTERHKLDIITHFKKYDADLLYLYDIDGHFILVIEWDILRVTHSKILSIERISLWTPF